MLHSHALWQSPTLIQDRWKSVYYPFIALFPTWWIRPNRGSDIGYLPTALFVVLLAFVVFIYWRVVTGAFRPGAFVVADRPRVLRRIMLVALGSLAVLLIVPGVLSTDLFSYIWYGRIFAEYHANPFLQVPADYTWNDPGHWLQWVYWKETPSVYGPVWVALAGSIDWTSRLLGGDIVNNLLGHKFLADLAHLANTVLVWKIAGIVVPSYWRRPGRLPAGVTANDWQAGAQIAITAAYAWNPLVLIEFGANGHNDILMVTGVLAALWLHLTGRWRLAVMSLGLAALIKSIALVFVPGYFWLLFWQAAPGAVSRSFARRVWTLVQAGLLLASTLVVAYIPFWQGPVTLKPLLTGPPVELYVNSIGDVIRWKLPTAISDLAANLGLQPSEFWTSNAIGGRLDWPVRFGANLIVATVALLQTWKARTFPAMIVAWGWILFAYLTVGAVWFWPWYVVWLLPLVAFLGPGRLLNGTIFLSGTSLLLYATFWRSSHDVTQVESWKGLVIQVPPLVYVLGSAWLEGRRLKRARREPAYRPREVPEAVRVPLVPAGVPQLARRAANDFDIAAYGGSPADGLLAGDQLDC